MITEHDSDFMAEAIELARRGRFTTTPNPAVGCVIVQDEKVIGRGWHQWPGEAHAEVLALEDAGASVRGATAYVSLEPCSHFGSTPPCADRLVEAGIGRVVAAMRDPDGRVRGEGLAKLRAAGIEVDTPCHEARAREINPGYVKRSETGLPRVRVKLAMSLDGRTAMASGESRWITGEDAREAVQLLRAESCAIVTGIGSVLADDPRLSVRTEAARVDGRVRQPLRVLVDSELRTPLDSALFDEAGAVLVATTAQQNDAWNKLEARGAELVRLEGSDGRTDLSLLVRELGRRGVNEVLVEAGATLAAGFLEQGLIDELIVFIAPVVLGSSARPLFALPGLERMADAIRLEIQEVAQIGQDCVLVLKPGRLVIAAG